MKLRNIVPLLAVASMGWTASHPAFADTLKQKKEVIEGSAVCEYFMLKDMNHAIEEYKKNHNRSTLDGAFGLFMIATTWNLLALDEGASQSEIDRSMDMLNREGLPQSHKDARECANDAGNALKSMPDAQAKRYFDASAAEFRNLSRKDHFEIPVGFFDQKHPKH